MGHLHDGEYINPAAIEIFPGSSAGHGGYIDFHYNNTSDYTSRIMERSSGVFQIYGSIGMDGTLTAPRLCAVGTLGIPLTFVRSDKSNTDKGWYQDIQFSTSDNIRTSVFRSQVDASGNRCLILGVSSKSNAAPTGLMIKRVEDVGHAYATVDPNKAYATSQIRNISAGTAAKTPGTSSLANGCIYVQYE